MGKNDEVYIGSVSPTITVAEQRQLFEGAEHNHQAQKPELVK